MEKKRNNSNTIGPDLRAQSASSLGWEAEYMPREGAELGGETMAAGGNWAAPNDDWAQFAAPICLLSRLLRARSRVSSGVSDPSLAWGFLTNQSIGA